MREAGVLLDLEAKPLYWHVPANRSAGSLPDSSDLWKVFWENRNNILGFAHSHPGKGVPSPSYEDITTFSAIELALGKRLTWWIISEDLEGVVWIRWCGPGQYNYASTLYESEAVWDLPWFEGLRARSYDEAFPGFVWVL